MEGAIGPASADARTIMQDLSVIICAHNPRKHYLERTLSALQAQTLDRSRWELLLIDNASDSPLSRDWNLSWHPHARHVVEGELGLSAARLRGMREAQGQLLVFVDDDNVLDADYLSEAITIEREWPLLGVWGSGVIAPEFEHEPAEHLRQYLFYLALRETTVPRWSNVFPCFDATPWGAGLCLRRMVASNYCRIWNESRIRLSDRVGRSLMSGGDMEIAYVACHMGLGMGVFPVLRLTHLIPAERVTTDYLVRMAEASTTSNYLLASKWQHVSPPSPFSPLGMLSVFKNIVVNRGLRRRMYLADLRARVAALRLIADSGSERESDPVN